jgi:hypothetical protein
MAVEAVMIMELASIAVAAYFTARRIMRVSDGELGGGALLISCVLNGATGCLRQ